MLSKQLLNAGYTKTGPIVRKAKHTTKNLISHLSESQAVSVVRSHRTRVKKAKMVQKRLDTCNNHQLVLVKHPKHGRCMVVKSNHNMYKKFSGYRGFSPVVDVVGNSLIVRVNRSVPLNSIIYRMRTAEQVDVVKQMVDYLKFMEQKQVSHGKLHLGSFLFNSISRCLFVYNWGNAKFVKNADLQRVMIPLYVIARKPMKKIIRNTVGTKFCFILDALDNHFIKNYNKAGLRAAIRRHMSFYGLPATSVNKVANSFANKLVIPPEFAKYFDGCSMANFEKKFGFKQVKPTIELEPRYCYV